MVLVDTSVWIDHLRSGNSRLCELLLAGDVACHSLVIGELACGNLHHRKEVVALLHSLPMLERLTDDEIIFFVEKHRLYGNGLGLIDMHLLAACALSNAELWTLDKRLMRVAEHLRIGLKLP